MVRAIIDRRKTKTRRVVIVPPRHAGGRKKVRPDPAFTRVTVGEYSPEPEDHRVPRIFGAYFTAPNGADLLVKCPYGRPGDELYVREAFRGPGHIGDGDRGVIGWGYEYLADESFKLSGTCGCEGPCGGVLIVHKNRPSIHMPSDAVRIRLKLETVAVERLLSISPADVRAEGVPENWMESDPVFFRQKGMDAAAHHVWDNMRALEQWRFFWDAMNGAGSSAEDPWVWVLGFSILEAPDKVLRFG